MVIPEIYWKSASMLIGGIILCISSIQICLLLKPFFLKGKKVYWIGITYFLILTILKIVPWEMEPSFVNLIGATGAFCVGCMLDKRNIEQKIFLIVTFYLLNWIAYGFTQIPASLLHKLTLNFPGMEHEIVQFGMFVLIQTVRILLLFFILRGITKIVHQFYTCKQEGLHKRELLFMLFPLISIAAGQQSFSYFSNIYVKDTAQYIWNLHEGYWWIQTFYQLGSMGVIFGIIIIYSKIKESQRQERENAVYTEQFENGKRHLEQVEDLYKDIRRLKHDMTNHIMTLEKLYGAEQRAEAQEYISELKRSLIDSTKEMQSGNPVTDVILSERMKEAEKKNVKFICDFHYPASPNINVFDISIILNNGIENAMEAVSKELTRCISVRSYQRNNAYMIEIYNSFSGKLEWNKEHGLPDSTKDNVREHGYGLLNIKRAAQKYQGDLDIVQEDEGVKLSILLMLY